MVHFDFTGNPSAEEYATSKKGCIEYLGAMKNEFEERNGSVLFNFNVPKSMKTDAPLILERTMN